MIFNKNSDRRLIIYFFFDEEGIVDSYVEYMLESLKKFTDEFLIVCNGKLNEEGKRILQKYGETLVRENKGFDVWAYKTALEYYGWDELKKYSEVILMNNTIMGPVFSWDDTFDKMDKMDLDFWGVTKSFKSDNNFVGSEYGYIPEHIQSHFVACRKTLIDSKNFRDYWESMPLIKGYVDSIKKHEIVFTKKFSDLGYKWDVSVNQELLEGEAVTPLLEAPLRMVKENRCPIIKRRSFFQDPGEYLEISAGEIASDIMRFLRDETDYSVDLIWETVLRKYHQEDIVKNMNLTYILPRYGNDLICQTKIKKVALIAHVFFDELLEQTFRYIKNIPEYVDVYVTTDTCHKKDMITEYAKKISKCRFKVKVIPNRGRDVSSLLIGWREIVDQYELICFVHDKKTGQVNPKSVGLSFAKKCFENTLGNREYIEDIIELFAANERLGIAMPPEPNHGIFFQCIGGEWGNNYELAKDLKKQLNLKVPMDISKRPVAPLGTMFWFRPKALKKLFEIDWKYEDFPEEPIKEDGTLLHAIERIYPFVVQDAGFYPAIIMNSQYATTEYGNLRYNLEEYNKILIMNHKGGTAKEMRGYFEKAANSVFLFNKEALITKAKSVIKKILKSIIPFAVCKRIRNRF